MRTYFDAMHKNLIDRALVRHDVCIAMEIPGQVLIADIWARANPAHMDDLAQLGLLGRMVAQGQCLIEPFSSLPRVSDIRSCGLKQHSLHHAQCRDAKADETAPEFPIVWIISNGSPDRVIAEMEFQPAAGWPAGVLSRRAGTAMHLVVLRKLPQTTDTLLLRMLGRGPTFRQAIQDLRALPDAHPALAELAERVYQVVFIFRRELKEHRDILEPEEVAAVQEIEETYHEWKQRVRREGKAEGIAEGVERGKAEGITEGIERGKAEGKADGIADSIRALCAHFDIPLTEQRQAQLAGLDAAELQQLLVAISAARAWPA